MATSAPTKVRELECGCWLMSDGSVWLVSEAVLPPDTELYDRPGRVIYVDGSDAKH